MAEDIDLINRIAACAATLGVAQPVGWAAHRSWRFAASEGWAAAYAGSAVERPGLDEEAVTDEMILDAVAAVLADESATGGGGSLGGE